MDYLEFFGLKEDPFKVTPDLAYFYPSKEHSEILLALNYAVTRKEGFFLATGEPGTGKTTILRVFIDEWRDKAEIALVLTPRLSPEEFLSSILEDLKVPVESTNKNEMIKAFRDFLLATASSGKTVVIVVDEAQNLPEETLEELRLLSNLETEKEKLLQIVLIGQAELRERLTSQGLKQLNQRLTIKTFLKPLTRQETSEYINYRSMKAGKGRGVFTEGAKTLIYGYSRGIPRLVNVVASRSLMAAFVDGTTEVQKRHVQYAIHHLSGQEKRYAVLHGFRKYAIFAGLGIVIGVVTVIGYRHISPDMNSPEGPVVERTILKGRGAIAAPTATGAFVGPERPQRAVVVVHSARLRHEPALDSKPVIHVSEGTSLPVLGAYETGENTWYKVKISDGRECWVSEKVVRLE